MLSLVFERANHICTSNGHLSIISYLVVVGFDIDRFSYLNFLLLAGQQEGEPHRLSFGKLVFWSSDFPAVLIVSRIHKGASAMQSQAASIP